MPTAPIATTPPASPPATCAPSWCLPAEADLRQLPELAAAELRSHGLTPAGVMPHFATTARRTSKLVELRAG